MGEMDILVQKEVVIPFLFLIFHFVCKLTSLHNVECIFLIVNFISSFYFAKRFRICVFSFLSSKHSVIFAFADKTGMLAIEFFLLLLCCAITIIFIFNSILRFQFFWTLAICCGYLFVYKIQDCEFRAITEHEKLGLGYGAALWYYKNYLDQHISATLVQRIREFESIEGVTVTKKLFILCPKSCKVPNCIDDTEIIHRCGELPVLEANFGGLKNRQYNITVYRICPEVQKPPFRCAVEYAQPLKNLFAFKEIERLTAEEMYSQRDLFCQSLRSFVENSRDLCNLCEILEYDDERTELSKVLNDSNHSGVEVGI